MTDATDVTVILDRSGSMESIATDVIGAFNTFIAEQQREPGECRLSLVQFNDEYEVAYADVPMADAPRLTPETFLPRGTTALLDAVGRTIDTTGRRLAALAEEVRPGRVLVAIITDGLENASTDYTRAKVLALIERQQTEYHWSFLFLAANQDAIKEGTALGVKALDNVNFKATKDGIYDAAEKLSASVSAYRSGSDAREARRKIDEKKPKIH
jgi:uncharacterized protein YegL